MGFLCFPKNGSDAITKTRFAKLKETVFSNINVYEKLLQSRVYNTLNKRQLKILNFNYTSVATKQLIAHAYSFKIVCSFKTETLLLMRYFDRKHFSRF